MNAPDHTWLAGYLYYTGARETFLTKAVAPFVHTVLTHGWAGQCFFIRYGERGPHIRLRFQGPADLLEHWVKPRFMTFFQQYYTRYPSQRDEPAWVKDLPRDIQWFPNNSVQFLAYEPESERLYWQKLPSYLFYYSNWLPTATDGPFFCAWSLAVEEQFYLLFGVVLVFLPRKLLIGGLVGAVFLKWVVCETVGPKLFETPFGRIAWSYREPIFIGVLLAFALDRREIYYRVARIMRHRWVPSLLALVLTLWLFLSGTRNDSSWDLSFCTC